MGYRSDVRIKLLKKDYYELVEQYNKARDKALTQEDEMSCGMSNLFGKTPKTDEEIVEFAKGKVDILYLQKNQKYCELDENGCESDNILTSDMIYFGWDYLKWYENYKDVSFIENFISNLEYYAFARLGEDYGDVEERSEGLDYIGFIRHFNDEQEKRYADEEEVLF